MMVGNDLNIKFYPSSDFKISESDGPMLTKGPLDNTESINEVGHYQLDGPHIMYTE